MKARSARSGLSRWLTGALVLAGFSSALGTGCSSDSAARGRLASGCQLNSDCNDSLVCTFGACHAACVSTKDCAPGERCTNTGEANVCQFASEASCVRNSECPAPLTCALDRECRTECETERDCTQGQICATGGVCAEQEEVSADGTLKNAADSGRPEAAGGTPGTGGAGAGGAGAGGAGAGGEDASTGAGGAGAGGEDAGAGGAGAGGEDASTGAGGAGEGGQGSGGALGSGGADAGAGGAAGGTTASGGSTGDASVEAGPPCGELGLTCCATGPECVSGKNLACSATACDCDLGFTDCNASPTDGCESDLTADSENCGVCGHDCLGGACLTNRCQPNVLVQEGTAEGQSFTNTWDPGAGPSFDYQPMDAAGVVLPVTDSGGKYQLRAFDNTGTPGNYLTTDAAGIQIYRGPWITGSGVFWYDTVTGAPALRRVARGGGTVSTPYSPTVSFTDVRIDSGTLYLRDGNDLVKIVGGTLTPTAVYDLTAVSGCCTPSRFGVLGSALFIIVGSSGGALHEGTTDGVPFQSRDQNFLPTGCVIGGIAVTAEAVYGYGQCPNSRGYISRYDRALSQRSDLLFDNPAIVNVGYLVADATTVYFVDNSTVPYRLFRMPAAGGSMSVLSTLGPFRGLGQLGSSLYSWSGPGGLPTGFSRIVKP